MFISDKDAKNGINLIVDWAVKRFAKDAARTQVERQRAVFEDREQITNVLTDTQLKARSEGAEFVPDTERANDYGTRTITSGVRIRLEGAYSCYKADMQLECLRHILAALDTVFCVIGWDKASAYINKQNHVLLEMSKDEREAA